MDLYFLGTGAGVPSARRNVSAVALRMYEERNGFWLFDCGEATQHQVLHSPLKLSRLERLFITHLHGDHLFGLPGLLSSRSFQTQAPLTLYGPPGLAQFVSASLQASGTYLTYPLEVFEVQEGTVFDDGQFQVEAAVLDHGVPCFGYRVTEADKPGRLRVEVLQQMGIPPGPLYGLLKQGQTVRLGDGRVIDGREMLDPPVPGRIVTILGDTRPCDNAVRLAQGAHLLVHEATFTDEHAGLAREYGHSTSREAANIARQAGVYKLVLTHISARYDEAGEQTLLNEALQEFPYTELAQDHSIHEVPPAARARGDS